MDEFVRIKIAEWPEHVNIETITDLSEIFYLDKVWKGVNKNEIHAEIRANGEKSAFWCFNENLETYDDETIIFGYNPFESEIDGFFCANAEIATKIKNTLTDLKISYINRVRNTKLREPKEWHSLGSEREVDEARIESTRDKISVEWIGRIERQLRNYKFDDLNATENLNGCVQYISTNAETYKVELKTSLDVGVQVDVKQIERSMQTDVCQTLDEFLNDNLNDIESNTKPQRQLAVENEINLDEEVPSKDETVDDESLNYFSSFVNTEKRSKIISSVAWHPSRRGYVAIAYTDKLKKDLCENLFSIEPKIEKPQLVPKKARYVNEDDIKINKAIFDIMSREDADVNSFDSKSNILSECEDESESEDEGKHFQLEFDRKISDLIIYRQTVVGSGKNVRSKTISSMESQKIQTEDILDIDDDSILEMLAKQNTEEESLSTTDDSSDDNEDSESDTKSEINTEIPPIIPVFDEVFSDDSDSVEDNIPVFDTDSFVLIWNCDNNLYPQMKLYYHHDINTIKFDPYNGEFLAGGSRSGQLVLWSVETEFDKLRHKTSVEEQDIIAEFMENLPTWDAEDKKYSTLLPIVVSDRNISHLDVVTCLEWIHPSIQISSNDGTMSKSIVPGLSKQIFTSSMDGNIKIWHLKKLSATSSDTCERMRANNSEFIWNLELIYDLLVNNPYAEKHMSRIRTFKIFAPPIRYTKVNENFYEFVPDIISKFHQILVVANNIGEVGVIRWKGRETVMPEVCQHDWWNICHDDVVSSLSQNYYFPNVILATGGRIFSLWNITYKEGPIWWRQYPKELIITHGSFSPYHPGIIYIAKRDGQLDIWDVKRQIHKPVQELKVTGFSISFLSIVTPPSTDYQIGIADSNGNFHILMNQYDMTWNDDDLIVVGEFFQQVEEDQKQLLHWNKTWKEQSTFTDIYGFERKPQAKKSKTSARKDDIKEDYIQTDVIQDDFVKEINFKEKLVQSEEYKKELAEIKEKMEIFKREEYPKLKEEMLARLQESSIESCSADDIFEKYCKC